MLTEKENRTRRHKDHLLMIMIILIALALGVLVFPDTIGVGTVAIARPIATAVPKFLSFATGEVPIQETAHLVLAGCDADFPSRWCRLGRDSET